MVMESLPMGGDTDPTIPMDLTGGMTAAVAEIIERGERVATPADPPPKEKEQARVCSLTGHNLSGKTLASCTGHNATPVCLCVRSINLYIVMFDPTQRHVKLVYIYIYVYIGIFCMFVMVLLF